MKNIFFNQNINIAFLFTSGRNGSIFLHSLLDGHPNILTIPIIFDSYQIYEECKSFKLNDIVNYTIKGDLSILFERKNTDSNGNFSNLNISKDIFINTFFKLLETSKNLSPKLFFEAIHISYAESIGLKLDNITLVLEHSHFYPFRIEEKMNDYPSAKFIHMMREPKASFYSYYEFYKSKKLLKSNYWIYILESAIYGYVTFKAFSKDKRYKFVKLEDLHSSPEKTIKDLCLFLDLTFVDSLLKSTFNGEPYISNSPSNGSIQGFSLKVLDNKYQNCFSKNDILFIETILKNLIKELNYTFDSKANMSLNDLNKYKFIFEKNINYFNAFFYEYSKNYSYIINKSKITRLLNKLHLLPIIIFLRQYQLEVKEINKYKKTRKKLIEFSYKLNRI